QPVRPADHSRRPADFRPQSRELRRWWEGRKGCTAAHRRRRCHLLWCSTSRSLRGSTKGAASVCWVGTQFLRTLGS
ncbi:unnamed protein product, partial [Linum tenue]